MAVAQHARGLNVFTETRYSRRDRQTRINLHFLQFSQVHARQELALHHQRRRSSQLERSWSLRQSVSRAPISIGSFLLQRNFYCGSCPQRDRPEDINPLARSFANCAARSFGTVPALATRLLSAFQRTLACQRGKYERVLERRRDVVQSKSRLLAVPSVLADNLPKLWDGLPFIMHPFAERLSAVDFRLGQSELPENVSLRHASLQHHFV